ncbi:FeS cluster assembly protein SufD [bacterium HR40]|nr:FeS cluster assembly protein SufD [bacterium HR40]
MTSLAVARRRAEPVPELGSLFERVRQRLPGREVETLARIRETAFARFLELGIPTQKAEEWKFSPVLRVINRPMALARRPDLPLAELSRWFAGGTSARRLVFANGHPLPELSHLGGLPEGVRITSLSRAIAEMPGRVAEVLAGLDDGRSFTFLNTALTECGALIEVADGVEVEAPLQLLFLSAGEASATMTHPRLYLRLGEKASLHLLEVHAAAVPGPVLTNLVFQIDLGAGARLVREKLQLGDEATSFLGRTVMRLETGARLLDNVATLGGGFVRNESELVLDGPGIEALLNGVYMPRGHEHVDTLIRVHHRAPRCHSNQFYKGVIEDKAHAAFAGKIIVHRDAQKTDAYQANNNLLVSDEAEVDTKPELEIYADDVRCSHGATVGDIDAQALFYLRSRGLPKEAAESLLVYAYAGEVLERFRDPVLVGLARQAVLERVPGGEMLEAEGLV